MNRGADETPRKTGRAAGSRPARLLRLAGATRLRATTGAGPWVEKGAEAKHAGFARCPAPFTSRLPRFSPSRHTHFSKTPPAPPAPMNPDQVGRPAAVAARRHGATGFGGGGGAGQRSGRGGNASPWTRCMASGNTVLPAAKAPCVFSQLPAH